MLHVGPHIIFGDSDELAIRAVPDISKDFDSILFLWDFCDLIKGKFISKGYWNLDIKVRCNSPSIHQFYILDWQRGREIIVQGTVKYCTVYICMLWSIFNVLNWNWYKVRFSWRSSKLQRGGCRQRSPWTFCVGL